MMQKDFVEDYITEKMKNNMNSEESATPESYVGDLTSFNDTPPQLHGR